MLTTLLIFVIGFFCSAAQAPPAKVVSKSEPKAVISRDQKEISKSITDILTRIDGRAVQEMKRAWSAAGAGMGSEEAVLLIFLMPDDSIQASLQGMTNERRAFTFKWAPSAVAIVHTHPTSVSPRPSPADRQLADTLGVPIFTLTARGMYSYEPHTKKVTKIHDALDWLELAQWKAVMPEAHRSLSRLK